MPIAPSTYYAARSRPPSPRAMRDERLNGEIGRVWRDNFEVYGAEKLWLELNRQGVTVARCTVARQERKPQPAPRLASMPPPGSGSRLQ